jgi:hypothetical protein
LCRILKGTLTHSGRFFAGFEPIFNSCPLISLPALNFTIGRAGISTPIQSGPVNSFSIQNDR